MILVYRKIRNPRSVFAKKCPANCRLSRVHRSAARRVTPPGTLMDPVLYNAWDRRIAAGKCKHLTLAGLVGLCVIFDERNAISIVMVAGLLAIRAARLCVHY